MNFHIVTLGCPKNEVDSEGMEVLLVEAGHRPVANFSDADLIVVNTCGFIDDARVEALSVLKEMAAKKPPGAYLVAAGCLAQREGESLARKVPGVDAVLGCRNWTDIAKIVDLMSEPSEAEENIPSPASTSLLGRRGRKSLLFPPGKKRHQTVHPIRLGGTGKMARGCGVLTIVGDDLQLGMARRSPKGTTAYLKISDGCDASCTFCIIPAIKGRYRSKPVGQVLAEAQQLVEGGVLEIILVGQDTTAYGLDLGERDGLPTLLRRIVETVPDLPWLRVLYLYPQRITDRLIRTISDLRQICRYLDIPLQHTHPATLRRMGRPQNDVVGLVSRLRDAIPDVAVRTTFIVGFPGETEDEHRHLLQTIEKVGFDRVGVFTFSPQKGTRAAKLPGRVSEVTKQRRWREAMEVAQKVSLSKNRGLVGRELEVLVEGEGEGRDGNRIMAGRSYRDAPEVDGLVFFSGDAERGKLVKVRVTGAMEYDLVGELVGRNGDGEG